MYRAPKGKSRILISLCALAWMTSLADPPRHAPAHGYRAKQAKHVGHTGVEWELDYGISSGTCDRQAVATVLGGIVGGVIANRVADSDNRKIATLIGAAAGALIGNRIGHNLDEADQACLGHALELGKTGEVVAWRNETTNVSYQLTPGADSRRNGSPCRAFTLMATSGSNRSSRQGLACQTDRGTWEVQQ